MQRAETSVFCAEGRQPPVLPGLGQNPEEEGKGRWKEGNGKDCPHNRQASNYIADFEMDEAPVSDPQGRGRQALRRAGIASMNVTAVHHGRDLRNIFY
jgi:hypothetical protein